MKSKKMHAYTWFIEPLDDHTNQAVAREKPDYELSELEFEGRPVKAIAVPHHVVRILEASRLQAGYDFNVFVRRESGGPLRRWQFERILRFRPRDREEVRAE